MFCNEIKLAYKPSVKASELPKITSADDSYKVIYPLYDQDTIQHIETFLVLFLNRANACIGWKTISVGGTSATVVDPKVIFQSALLMNAHALILSHNHPSGSLNPSKADIDITKKIKAGATLLDMALLDHIIVTGDNGYYSFANEGMI